MNKMKYKTTICLLILNLLAINLSHAVNIGDIFGNTIVEDITLSVPSDYTTIQEALSFIDDKRILTGAHVTIQVADGTYIDYEQIRITHVDGSKIQILGNTSNPENVVLVFASVGDGILTISGNHLGLIDGFTLDGNNVVSSGIAARRSSSITTGSNMVVRNFTYAGINANESSAIWCNGLISEYNNIGFSSQKGSSVSAEYCEANNNLTGYRAEKSGCVMALRSIATNNTTAYLALRNSYIGAYLSTVSGNSSDYVTEDTSYMDH